jgi:hypothetical protein
MAATKTVDQGVAYHVTDPSNNHITVAQDTKGITAQTVTVKMGGASLTLSKQNAIDLLAALTAFANTGTLS